MIPSSSLRHMPDVRTSYRVDNVPRLVQPFFLVAAWALGFGIYFYYLICRLTSRIRMEGATNQDLARHAVYCLWHESWWPYFVVFHRHASTHAMFSHPAAYMKPLHAAFRLMGVRWLFLGSSGEEGRQAANQVAELVRSGWSTTISPDGPDGPARTFRKGVLHIAVRAGVPVVPLAVSASPSISWPSWDSKRFPLPFSRITVRVHPPVYVNADDFDSAASVLTSRLSS